MKFCKDCKWAISTKNSYAMSGIVWQCRHPEADFDVVDGTPPLCRDERRDSLTPSAKTIRQPCSRIASRFEPKEEGNPETDPDFEVKEIDDIDKPEPVTIPLYCMSKLIGSIIFFDKEHSTRMGKDMQNHVSGYPTQYEVHKDGRILRARIIPMPRPAEE